MSLARSSTARSEQIVERPHHRRAAGEIAQALDVVVGLLAGSRRRRRPRWAPSASARWSSNVVMSSNEATATSTGAPNTISAARMAAVPKGRRPPADNLPFGARTGKIVDSRRKRRENPSRQGVAGEKLRQIEPDHAPIVRNLVGKFGGRRDRWLPTTPAAAAPGSNCRIFDAGPRLRRQRIFFQKVLPESLCGKVSHRIHSANLMAARATAFDVCSKGV